MINWLKPWLGIGRKTRSSAKTGVLGFLLLLLMVNTASCTRVVIYPSEETATAAALNSSTLAPALPPTGTALPQGGGEPLHEQYTPTIEPTNTQTPTLVPSKPTSTEKPPILYYTQGGDTLEALCARFGVEADEIASPDIEDIPANSILNTELLLIIPNRLEETSHHNHLIPDSEIIFSPSAIDFDIQAFVEQAGGYLIDFREWRTDGWYNGAQVVKRVAYENSINPRLLLAVLEFQSNWLYGQPSNLAELDYPIGWKVFEHRELYKQLSWAVQQLSIGYYGWRTGRVTHLEFPDGSSLRLAPELNAGSVSIMYLFSKLYDQREWGGMLYSPEGFIDLYVGMFGDPWMRAQAVEPLFPQDIEQPPLILPFEVGKTWNFTGGPHAVWGPDGVMAAVDFAPPSGESGCMPSEEWVVAAASGLVTRSYNGIVVIDTDGDGYEQTGWGLFYLHIHHEDRVPENTWVNVGDRIGHPSCEGGRATGTHMHIARKYNGEWIPADGPLPFDLAGWQVHQGDQPYLGTLTKGERMVTANVYSTFETKITREPEY